MCAALSPEVLLDFREVVKIVEGFHAAGNLTSLFIRRPAMSARGTASRLLLRAPRSRRFGWRTDPLFCTRLIPLPNNSQPGKRKKLIGVLNVFRPARDEFCLPARGDHLRLRAQFRFHSRQYSVHHVDSSVEQASLNIRHGIGPDHLTGILDFNARQPRSSAEKRFGRNPQPRRTGATKKFTAR